MHLSEIIRKIYAANSQSFLLHLMAPVWYILQTFKVLKTQSFDHVNKILCNIQAEHLILSSIFLLSSFSVELAFLLKIGLVLLMNEVFVNVRLGSQSMHISCPIECLLPTASFWQSTSFQLLAVLMPLFHFLSLEYGN
ncbi:hypothetical protein PGT21_024251 [Puccinia graminis f. sp. tritici]|uniref:Uncharacterized protein n=1 Tax=Puccinia graminis f. sp. tritici TaxID=56615 RepID=A0A5B0LV63_PUCGR|nr:hypothetical protein PGT21_024251 [Puccinia graminis f. sp. tritici]